MCPGGTTVTINLTEMEGSVLAQQYLEFTHDKFSFRVDTSCLYHTAETWARDRDGVIVVGVTDFLQINSGDVVFIEVPEAGTTVAQGGVIGTIETIKTTVTIISPVSGEIIETNEIIATEPEQINADAYGTGWLIKVQPSDWKQEQSQLLSAEAYFPLMVDKVQQAGEK